MLKEKICNMQTYKNYNIQIKGRVQDIGFRDFVVNIAKSLNIKGMVYNSLDGTVKIVCGGTTSAIKGLIGEIKAKSANVGSSIDDIYQEEIPGGVNFPPFFFKAPTDELSDISRKLDIGVKSIQGVERNTEVLINGQDHMIKGQVSLVKGQDHMIKGQDHLIKGQDSLVKGQDRQEGHLKDIKNILERIAEKI